MKKINEEDAKKKDEEEKHMHFQSDIQTSTTIEVSQSANVDPTATFWHIDCMKTHSVN